MRLLKSFMIFSLITLSNCLQAMPAQVAIIRHAEKPPEGIHLDLRGLERSAALAAYFLGTPEVTKFGKPFAIYAANPTDEHPSMRPIETVMPLAAALQTKIDKDFDQTQLAELVDDIKSNSDYEGKMVLISWEHESIPALAAKFGVKTAPDKWNSEVYDRVWLITFPSEGEVAFKNIPQKLMYGDSSS
jgi:hypothetical protein